MRSKYWKYMPPLYCCRPVELQLWAGGVTSEGVKAINGGGANLLTLTLTDATGLFLVTLPSPLFDVFTCILWSYRVFTTNSSKRLYSCVQG